MPFLRLTLQMIFQLILAIEPFRAILARTNIRSCAVMFSCMPITVGSSTECATATSWVMTSETRLRWIGVKRRWRRSHARIWWTFSCGSIHIIHGGKPNRDQYNAVPELNLVWTYMRSTAAKSTNASPKILPLQLESNSGINRPDAFPEEMEPLSRCRLVCLIPPFTHTHLRGVVNNIKVSQLIMCCPSGRIDAVNRILIFFRKFSVSMRQIRYDQP